MCVPRSREVELHDAKCELIDSSAEFRRVAAMLSHPAAREFMFALADELDEQTAALLAAVA